MELVEGPTLADRIAHDAVPMDEALPIAKQIAEALLIASCAYPRTVGNRSSSST